MAAATASKKTSSKPAAKATGRKPAKPKAAKKTAAQAAAEQTPADTNGKGYDPSIPLEDRTEAEKDATLAALNAPPEDVSGKVATERATKAKAKGKPRGDSLMSKIEKVLRDADGPMHVKDIVDKLGSKAFSNAPTPPTTRTYVQLHAGIAKGKTVKVDKGTFDLKDLNPKGAKKRPAAK